MSTDFELISLDLETSGSNCEEFTILSMGLVRLSDMSSFYQEVRHDSLMVSPEATRIHNLDLSTRDDRNLPTMFQADIALREWITQGKDAPKKNYLIPMGMNVGTFDMAFVRKYLPKSADLFGYRSLDLNAILFLDSLIKGRSYEKTKKAAKMVGDSYAHHYVPDLKPHNALYDAFSNVGVLHFVAETELGAVGVGLGSWEGGGLQ